MSEDEELWERLVFSNSQHSAVCTATDYGLGGQGFAVRVSFSTQCWPDRFWGLPSLLTNGYRGLFPSRYSDYAVKLTTHHKLVPRSRVHVIMYPLSRMSSWRRASFVKHRDNFTFTFYLWFNIIHTVFSQNYSKKYKIYDKCRNRVLWNCVNSRSLWLVVKNSISSNLRFRKRKSDNSFHRNIWWHNFEKYANILIVNSSIAG
jgi:hypothetical protein